MAGMSRDKIGASNVAGFMKVVSMLKPSKVNNFTYRKVESSRPVYYSILKLFGQRSQYISIKFALYKSSENPWVCY